MSSPSSLGIVGLGLLGSAIADRCLQHGWKVQGFDLDPARREALTALGGQSLATADRVFLASDLVLICLPNSKIVNQLITDVESSLHAGQTLIDATTGDPEDIAELAGHLEARGVGCVEARVCGSSEQLRQGQATLVVAGATERVDALRPLFEMLCPRVFNLGAVGRASQFKLVHNLIMGLNRAVMAEGLQLARSLGFDAEQSMEILLQTPAASKAMESKGRKMALADYTPHATLAQHLKDVELILSEANKSGALAPLSALHRSLLQKAVQAGFGEADNTAIIEAFRKSSPEG